MDKRDKEILIAGAAGGSALVLAAVFWPKGNGNGGGGGGGGGGTGILGSISFEPQKTTAVVNEAIPCIAHTRDSNNNPLGGVPLYSVITFPNGSRSVKQIGTSNAQGIFEFNLIFQSPGTHTVWLSNLPSGE